MYKTTTPFKSIRIDSITLNKKIHLLIDLF